MRLPDANTSDDPPPVGRAIYPGAERFKGERRTYSPSMADLPYDAILLVSFGGPEGPDDVIPFLENVTRGRGIPRERLAQVGEHYAHFGGVSPINEQCRRQRAALGAPSPTQA